MTTRKGVSTEMTVITLIVFGAIAIVLFIVYKTLFEVGKSHFTDSECQSSLLLTKAVDAAQPTCWVKVTNPIPIKCDRHLVTVTEKTVTIGDTELTELYSPACPSGGNDCLAQNVVAEEMRRCWKLFFEGEQAVLQQVETSGFSHLNNHNNYARACFVCGEVTIPKQMDLLAYLKTAKMKTKAAPYYYDYLAKNDKAWCDKDLHSLGPTCFEAMNAKVDASWYKKPGQVIGYAEPDRKGIALDKVAPGKYAVVFVRRGIGACTLEESDGTSGHEMTYLTNAIALISVNDVGTEKGPCDAVVV